MQPALKVHLYLDLAPSSFPTALYRQMIDVAVAGGRGGRALWPLRGWSHNVCGGIALLCPLRESLSERPASGGKVHSNAPAGEPLGLWTRRASFVVTAKLEAGTTAKKGTKMIDQTHRLDLRVRNYVSIC